ATVTISIGSESPPIPFPQKAPGSPAAGDNLSIPTGGFVPDLPRKIATDKIRERSHFFWPSRSTFLPRRSEDASATRRRRLRDALATLRERLGDAPRLIIGRSEVLGLSMVYETILPIVKFVRRLGRSGVPASPHF